MVRWALIAALVLVNALAGIPPFLSEDGGYLLRACSYSFFHANWWHVAVNCLAAWTIFDPRRKNTAGQILSAYLIAVLVYPLSFRPVIGFSNVLYAMIGLRTPPLSSPWWKRGEVAVFLAVTIAMVLIPRFSATTHVAAFALGIAGAYLHRAWLKFTEDARRNY